MAEYIEREEVMNRLFTEYATDSKADIFELIRSIPAADVQPFKWVRCEESLPVYDGLVLVADRDNNIRLGIFTETGWLSQFGNPMIPRPKAWAKIPELPEAIKG